MESEAKITVLVTGFGPFRNYNTNPSWEAVKLLPDLLNNCGKSYNVNLIIEEVPVAYKHVDCKIKELWEKYKPDIIVHTGVSGQSSCLTIESQARNKGYIKPDIHDELPIEDSCDSIILQTNCKIGDICSEINKQSQEIICKATISNNAGYYLCEYIYYQSLSIKKPLVLFVHIPETSVYSSIQSAQGLLKIVIYLIECTIEEKCKEK